MPDGFDAGNGSPSAYPHVPATAGLEGLEYRTAAEAAPEVASVAAHRVGWGFISLYTLAYISTSLLFLAPLLVTLALKVNALVGIEQAPNSLAVVTGTGNRLAMFLGPCVIGGFFILLFAVRLHDRRLARADRPAWSLREFASTFYVNP